MSERKQPAAGDLVEFTNVNRVTYGQMAVVLSYLGDGWYRVRILTGRDIDVECNCKSDDFKIVSKEGRT
jgi:hypothetical protein